MPETLGRERSKQQLNGSLLSLKEDTVLVIDVE